MVKEKSAEHGKVKGFTFEDFRRLFPEKIVAELEPEREEYLNEKKKLEEKIKPQQQLAQ